MRRDEPISTFLLAILGLIAQAPRSGYDLRKIFSTTPMGHFSSSPGAIYPALGRLEKMKWIEGRIENPKTLRPRQVFRLAPKGKEALTRHVGQPVTHDDIVWKVDDLLLRFGFMGDLLGREATVQFLGEFLARVEAYIPVLKQHLESLARHPAPVPTGRFALEHGIESYELQARWARRVIRELSPVSKRRPRAG
jgi:DNA-binding PadR family transcriptional regulator